MKRIGLLYHPRIPQSLELAREIENALAGQDAAIWTGSSWESDAILQRISDLDLLITLGGDGTIVRVARTVAAVSPLPILGVNLGRLGFLAELEPWEATTKLPAILAGEYWIEERSMIHVTVWRAKQGRASGPGGFSDETGSPTYAQIASYDALNDVVVGRGRLARAVRVSMHIDGEFLTTYTADGVIIATPTGSAAYSLSAGGPILGPNLTDILVTPIAPHLAIVRALVLPGTSTVRLDVSTNYDAVLSVDGQIDLSLQKNDRITVSGSKHHAHFVRTQPPAHFYRSLVKRLRGRIDTRPLMHRLDEQERAQGEY